MEIEGVIRQELVRTQSSDTETSSSVEAGAGKQQAELVQMGKRIRGCWKRAERRVVAICFVDEVVAVARVAKGEGDLEDGDVLLRAHDGGLGGEVGARVQAGAVDAHVREARRVGEPEGDLDGLTAAWA